MKTITKKAEYAKTLEFLQENHKKQLDQKDDEIRKLKKRRDPIKVSFNWKRSKFFWQFMIVLAILVSSLVWNGFQFFDHREQKQTIQRLEHYSIVVRVAKTMNGIEANDIHRILRDLQNSTGDTTRLMHEVYRRIQEFESGEATIQRVQAQK